MVGRGVLVGSGVLVGGGGWVGVLVGVLGGTVQKNRVAVDVGVCVYVSVWVGVAVSVWVGVGVSGSMVGVKVRFWVNVLVGVKVSVGVRVKNGREVGALARPGLKSIPIKDSCPLKPAHKKMITGSASSSHIKPSRSDGEIMGLRR